MKIKVKIDQRFVIVCSYFLERSQSARVTLAKAIELCPDPDEVGYMYKNQNFSVLYP